MYTLRRASLRLKKVSPLAFRAVVKKEANRKPPSFRSWFDMWHHHVDWDGNGKLSTLHRKYELWALFYALRKLQRLVKPLGNRIQVFAYVHENTPENDAVYLHTENPNGTVFPFVPEVKEWLHEAPFWLARYVSLESYRVGVNKFDGERYYYIERKA